MFHIHRDLPSHRTDGYTPERTVSIGNLQEMLGYDTGLQGSSVAEGLPEHL